MPRAARFLTTSKRNARGENDPSSIWWPGGGARSHRRPHPSVSERPTRVDETQALHIVLTHMSCTKYKRT